MRNRDEIVTNLCLTWVFAGPIGVGSKRVRVEVAEDYRKSVTCRSIRQQLLSGGYQASYRHSSSLDKHYRSTFHQHGYSSLQ